MAGAFVQQNNGSDVVANPVMAAWGSALTVGNWVAISSANGSGTVNYLTAPSGGGVTTWTRATSQVAGAIDLEVWYGKVTSNVTTGATLGFALTSASRLAWAAQEVSGLDATAPFDKAGTAATGTSTTPLSGASGTLASADSYLIGTVGWGASATATAGAGYGNVGQGGGTATAARFCAHESKAVAVTTSDTAGFTLSVSTLWACMVTAWTAAVAAGPSGPSTRPVVGGNSSAVYRAGSW
jgi:hypothetical protein